VEEEVERFEREVDPPAAQPDATVARALGEVVAEEPADVREDAGLAGGVEPVAPEVHRTPIDLEARRRPTDVRVPLDDRGLGEAERAEAVRRADTGGTAAEDDDVGEVGHG
jgi:hypothetical protein